MFGYIIVRLCPPVPSVVTQVSERRGEERGWRHGLGEMSYYNIQICDLMATFHFIQTATTIYYCAEEMEKSIDNRSDG